MFAGWLQSHMQEHGRPASGAEFADQFSDEEIARLMLLWEQERYEEKYKKFESIFPETFTVIGETEYHPRHLYPKHMEHFKAGKQFDERCFMAGNRVGKTVAGAFELTCHLTGIYPEWWPGRKFRKPIKAYACGKTNETTRDIVQAELFGEIQYQGKRKGVDGSGMIPVDCIGRGPGQMTWKAGVADLLDTCKIKHVSGGWSRLGLKSYQQGRGAFEGTAQHVIWADEEPEQEVYDEMRIRTMTTNGITILTYTPLDGMTETVIAFLPDNMRPPSDETIAAMDWSGIQ